ncbi:cytochrome-c peroxidase [Halomonadaceae bacterium KBTZ08]
MKRTAVPIVVLIALLGCLAVAGPVQASDGYADYRERFEPLPAMPPIPENNSLTPEKVELGKMLFFEPRISSSGVISCATCHNPALGWTDRIPRATGHRGQVGKRNTPTVLNAGFFEDQFWDGRADDLEEQALGPIEADVEMAMDLDKAIDRLSSFDVYLRLFDEAFPGEKPINADNVAKAIASFERTLNTPNSRFDRYLRGDLQALSEKEKKGMKTFVDAGCVACHQGPALTDSNYHRFEVPGSTDKGRFVVTGKESDKFKFKTPTLRNVAVTYPYFNNGSVEELDKAIELMADQMLNRELSDEKVEQIEAFLHTLTGEMPEVSFPALP